MNNVDKIYVQTLQQLQNRTISSNTLPVLLVEIMQIVDKEKIGNKQKKVICINVLKLLVQSITVSNEEQYKMYNLIDNTVPILIDIYVSIDKGELRIKERVDFFKCF